MEDGVTTSLYYGRTKQVDNKTHLTFEHLACYQDFGAATLVRTMLNSGKR